MNFKSTSLYTILSFILFIITQTIGFGRPASPEKPPEKHPDLILARDCRDTTIYHTEKVAFLMVVNFNASTFRWRTGYRKWSTLEKIGNCKSISIPPKPIYTYYFSNNKTRVKQDIVDTRVLKP